MNVCEIKAVVPNIKKATELDYLSQLLWQHHSKGEVSDNTAQDIAEAIAAQRKMLLTPGARRWTSPILNRPTRSYSTSGFIQRRRHQAALGYLPPATASAFTLGEQSVLSVIAILTLKGGGICDAPIAKIAALAACSRTVVQSAIRQARRLGLLRVTERPRQGQPSLTNIVEITDKSWQQWLARRGNVKGDRVKFNKHQEYTDINYGRLSRPSGRGFTLEPNSGCGLGRNLSAMGT
jgi:hypothetical protein